MLSIGGDAYTEGGFTSADAATAGANKIWAMFGPVQSGNSALRPFGASVLDGFDFDFEVCLLRHICQEPEVIPISPGKRLQHGHLREPPPHPHERRLGKEILPQRRPSVPLPRLLQL